MQKGNTVRESFNSAQAETGRQTRQEHTAQAQHYTPAAVESTICTKKLVRVQLNSVSMFEFRLTTWTLSASYLFRVSIPSVLFIVTIYRCAVVSMHGYYRSSVHRKHWVFHDFAQNVARFSTKLVDYGRKLTEHSQYLVSCSLQSTKDIVGCPCCFKNIQNFSSKLGVNNLRPIYWPQTCVSNNLLS